MTLPSSTPERGEQGRRAVAFVIVREGCAFPPLQRKTRLGPVERLDLAFLVDGDHCRVAGRVHVETDVQWVTAPGGFVRQVRSSHGMQPGLRHCGMPGGRPVAQRPHAFLGEALLPAPHHRPADADPPGNLQHRRAGGQQDDLRPLNVFTGRPLSSMTPCRSALC